MAFVARLRVMFVVAQDLILIKRHHQSVLLFIQCLVLINLKLVPLMHEMGADRCSFSSRHFILFFYPFVIFTLSCDFSFCDHWHEILIMR